MGHDKYCLAAAIICAVENNRDYELMGDIDFRIAAQKNEFLYQADDYLETGLTTCKCKENK